MKFVLKLFMHFVLKSFRTVIFNAKELVEHLEKKIRASIEVDLGSSRAKASTQFSL